MKKIILYVKDDVIDTYKGVFSSMDDFKLLKEMPDMMKALLLVEGIKYFEHDIDKIKDKDLIDYAKNKMLYGTFQDMIILSDNLIDLKVENIDE